MSLRDALEALGVGIIFALPFICAAVDLLP